MSKSVRKRNKKSKRGKSMTLPQFMKRFPDERAAERWFEKLRWGHGITWCPRCCNFATLKTPNRKPMPYWCGKCRRHFNVRTDTVMAGSKLSHWQWAYAIHAFVAHPKGISSVQLHRDLGVTQKTAWFLLHRIREAFTQVGTFRLPLPFIVLM